MIRAPALCAAALAALLLTYPYGTLSVLTLLYLAAIPLSHRRFEHHMAAPAPQPHAYSQPQPPAARIEDTDKHGPSAGQTKH